MIPCSVLPIQSQSSFIWVQEQSFHSGRYHYTPRTFTVFPGTAIPIWRLSFHSQNTYGTPRDCHSTPGVVFIIPEHFSYSQGLSFHSRRLSFQFQNTFIWVQGPCSTLGNIIQLPECLCFSQVLSFHSGGCISRTRAGFSKSFLHFHSERFRWVAVFVLHFHCNFCVL